MGAAAAGLPPDQMARKAEMNGRSGSVFHEVEEQVGRSAPDLFSRLGDVGDGGTKGACQMEVVKADEGDLAGQRDAVFLEGFVDEDDDRAVGAEHGIRGLATGEGLEQDCFSLVEGVDVSMDERLEAETRQRMRLRPCSMR